MAADAISAFVSRVVLTYISTCLVTKFQRRFPGDGPLISKNDDGTEVHDAVPFAVPGAASVIIVCRAKKAMNTDILLSTRSSNCAMAEELPDPERKTLSTKTPGAENTIVFKPGFAKISLGRVFCGFDKATSRGECKEEFILDITPQFIFREIQRDSIDMFLGKGGTLRELGLPWSLRTRPVSLRDLLQLSVGLFRRSLVRSPEKQQPPRISVSPRNLWCEAQQNVAHMRRCPLLRTTELASSSFHMTCASLHLRIAEVLNL